MLDQRFVRKNPDAVRQAAANKNERVDVDRFLDLDERRRELLQTVESLKQRRNTVSDEIARMKRDGEDASERIAEMREVSTRIKGIDADLAGLQDSLQAILERLPNLPHPSVPVGADESANQEVRRWGARPKWSSNARPTGTSGKRSTSSTFNGRARYRAVTSSSSRVRAPGCSGR